MPSRYGRNFLRLLYQALQDSGCRLGGSDSMGLLVAPAFRRSPQMSARFPLPPAPSTHALRPQSAREAEDVAAFCCRARYCPPVYRWEGAKPSTGIQAAAREQRYELLPRPRGAWPIASRPAIRVTTSRRPRHARCPRQRAMVLETGGGRGAWRAGWPRHVVRTADLGVAAVFSAWRAPRIRSFLQACGVFLDRRSEQCQPRLRAGRVRAGATSRGCRRPCARRQRAALPPRAAA